MTSGPDPPWRIYGDPFTSRLRQTRRAVARVRTPMALGNTYCPRSPTTRPLVPTVGAAPDEVRREDQGIVGDASAVTPQGCHKSPRVERSLCSIPWQGDFPRGNVPTVEDALRSVHRKLDDCPISMEFYEFAAIDGPEETSATEMHQRIIAMATEQS